MDSQISWLSYANLLVIFMIGYWVGETFPVFVTAETEKTVSPLTIVLAVCTFAIHRIAKI